ncbi:tetratricopeptide repeat protein [Geomonas oryzisoli]|uniref:Tetratricopeptide repeat protein n=1 Tax=Geomonas oryzisoli TaxID=2847992 RepID=A0ABX8J113_9BACT|nr:tetratricopeptide repeat protein [Geomonas oryzisoli]QWV91924.1 tetratricopeptide repeat protein [Geomonas oryzisoli]
MIRPRTFMPVALLLLASGCALSQAEKNKSIYHYQMGQSFFAENNFTGALQELTEAEKLTPKDPELLNLLGLTYFRKGRYELAEAKYLKALDLRENYSEARNNLGVNYLEMKRWDDAIAQFKVVQEDLFFQGQDNAAGNLGLAYLGKGDYQQALAVLRGLVAKNGSDPRTRVNLGRVYFAMNKTELAVEEYQKALRLTPSYASAHYHMGLAQMKLKDADAAKSAFQEVVRIAPDSEMGQLSREYLDLLKVR